jgi:hypothetical protein
LVNVLVNILLTLLVSEKSNLKGEIIHFSSEFQKFQFRILGSIDSAPVVRQNIILAGACGEGTCLSHDRQKLE